MNPATDPSQVLRELVADCDGIGRPLSLGFRAGRPVDSPPPLQRQGPIR
jgi:hypothetical protein